MQKSGAGFKMWPLLDVASRESWPAKVDPNLQHAAHDFLVAQPAPPESIQSSSLMVSSPTEIGSHVSQPNVPSKKPPLLPSAQLRPYLHNHTTVLLHLAHKLDKKIRTLVLLLLGLLLALVLLLPLVVTLLVLLLLLVSSVLLLAVARVATMLLLLLLVMALLLLTMVLATLRREDRLAALEVDQDTTRVMLVRRIVEPHLATELLDSGLELLDAALAVVALADNGVDVRLAAVAVGAHAHLEDALGLLDELAVEVNLVLVDAARGIVGAEDKVGRLLVVGVYLGVVVLALVGELLGGGAVAVAVGLLGAIEARPPLLGLGPGQIAETVVLALRLVIVVVRVGEG